MNIQEAKRLKYHQTIYEKGAYNADGTPMRWRINGKLLTWKTQPNRIKIPLAHGLYEHTYLTEHNLEHFTIKEPTKRTPQKPKGAVPVPFYPSYGILGFRVK